MVIALAGAHDIAVDAWEGIVDSAKFLDQVFLVLAGLDR